MGICYIHLLCFTCMSFEFIAFTFVCIIIHLHSTPLASDYLLNFSTVSWQVCSQHHPHLSVCVCYRHIDSGSGCLFNPRWKPCDQTDREEIQKDLEIRLTGKKYRRTWVSRASWSFHTSLEITPSRFIH